MGDRDLDDGVVLLAAWAEEDAGWYVESTRDPLIQRFTTESPKLEAAQVVAAIRKLHRDESAEGFLIRDAVTGERLGNIALSHDGHSGEVSYWVAAAARGRGVATRALALFSRWSLRTVGLREVWLCVHRDNTASQRAAVKAGYQRAASRDKTIEVKGTLWPMLGYALSAGDLRASSPDEG
jgi:ribosomal-protein-alanine N-acetyltransferase